MKKTHEEPDIWQYLQPRELKKVTSFRVPPDLLERVDQAAATIDIPVCDLWEAAMRKTLDELKTLAKRHNISTTGTKNELLQRILQKVPRQ